MNIFENYPRGAVFHSKKVKFEGATNHDVFQDVQIIKTTLEQGNEEEEDFFLVRGRS